MTNKEIEKLKELKFLKKNKPCSMEGTIDWAYEVGYRVGYLESGEEKRENFEGRIEEIKIYSYVKNDNN